MTREDVLRMAREAGFIVAGDPDDLCVIVDDNDCIATNEVMRFAALIAQAENEACAKVCEGLRHIEGQFVANEFAREIRARGQE